MTPLCKVVKEAANMAVLLAVVALASPALAQDEEQTARARALFERGVELSDAGQWPDAADHFGRSLEVRWSSVVAYNLAVALSHGGRLLEAQEHLRDALRDEGASERLRTAAQAQLAALEPRLAQLTLEVSGPRDGVELTLDDELVPDALIGVAMPEDPGHHTLVALRAGEIVARAELALAEGQAAILSLAIPPSAVPPPEETALRATPVEDPPAAVEIAAPRAQDDTVFVALGIAGGVLVVGTVVAIAAALAVQGHGDPVEGNLGPSVIVFE